MVKGRFSKELWISFGILIGSVIIAAVVMQFIAGKMSADVAAIVSDRAAAESQTNTLSDLAALEGAVPKAVQYQAAINQLLPDQYGIVTFPQWLSQLATNYNVTANAVFQGAVTPPAGNAPGTAQFSFTVQGSPEEVASFITGMNTATGFLMELTSFNVQSGGSGETITGQGNLFFR